MLPLLFAGIVFAFMLLGSMVFVVCIILPPTRRYALSAALWCAVWGPCSVALMNLAGVALVAAAFTARTGDAQSVRFPHLLAAFGWTYLISGVLVTTTVATGAAFLHQFLTQRLTFMLFRLYATAVVAGIGSVFGWCFSWWMAARTPTAHIFIWDVAAMLVLIGGFGTAAYKRAYSLRGDPPRTLTWITPTEFAPS